MVENEHKSICSFGFYAFRNRQKLDDDIAKDKFISLGKAP